MPIEVNGKLPKKSNKVPVPKDHIPLDQVWTPKDGVTKSMLETFLRCRQQCLWKYLFGMTPSLMSGPIEYGNIVHYLLEHAPVDRERRYKDISPTVVGRLLEKCRKVRMSLGSAAFLKPHERMILDGLFAQAGWSMPAYFKWWKPKDERVVWVSREEVFRVEVPEVTLAGRPLVLTGKMDGVIQAEKDRRWLFETKTKGRISEKEIHDVLPWDFQTNLYLWAIWRRSGESKPLHGVAYNVLRRSSAGAKVGESVEEFVSRMRADVAKRPGWYFMRWRSPTSAALLSQFFSRSLLPILRSFVLWYEGFQGEPQKPWTNPHHYLDPGNLWSKYGKDQLFDLLTKDLPDGFYQRKKAHGELEVEI